MPSIGRRRPVPGGCWAPHGGLGGHIAPADRADTWPLPPPALAAGVQASRGPPGRGRGIRAGGVWPAVTMALGCIVVKAPKVLQRRLVTELILVLWVGGGLGQGLRSPAAAQGSPSPSGASPRPGSCRGRVTQAGLWPRNGLPSTCLQAPLPCSRALGAGGLTPALSPQ